MRSRDIAVRGKNLTSEYCRPNGNVPVTICHSNRTHLTGTVVTSRNELETYAHEWNELLSSSEANTMFLTWEWISTWLEVVFPDAELFVVVVRDESSQLIAIAPFYHSTLKFVGVFKYKCLRIIGDCECGGEYSDVIIRRGFEEKAMKPVMDALVKHSRVWDCIWIRDIAGWTGAPERLRLCFGKSGLYIHKRAIRFSAISLPDTHDAFLGSLPKKRRGYVKRQTRLQISERLRLILRQFESIGGRATTLSTRLASASRSQLFVHSY